MVEIIEHLERGADVVIELFGVVVAVSELGDEAGVLDLRARVAVNVAVVVDRVIVKGDIEVVGVKSLSELSVYVRHELRVARVPSGEVGAEDELGRLSPHLLRYGEGEVEPRVGVPSLAPDIAGVKRSEISLGRDPCALLVWAGEN